MTPKENKAIYFLLQTFDDSHKLILISLEVKTTNTNISLYKTNKIKVNITKKNYALANTIKKIHEVKHQYFKYSKTTTPST